MTIYRSTPNAIVRRPRPWWRRISLAWRARRWYARMVRDWYRRTSEAMRGALAEPGDLLSFREAVRRSGVTLEQYLASAKAMGYRNDTRYLTAELAKRVVDHLRSGTP